MPTTFLSLPRELCQAILLLSHDNLEDFNNSTRESRELMVECRASILRRVSLDIMADVDYVQKKWLKEVDDSEKKWDSFVADLANEIGVEVFLTQLKK